MSKHTDATDGFAELRRGFQEEMKNAPPAPEVTQRIGHCSCTWAYFPGGMATCGCGEAHIRIYRDEDSYHFEGKHWDSLCLIEELLKRLGLPGFEN
jgi:hypothetical protein